MAEAVAEEASHAVDAAALAELDLRIALADKAAEEEVAAAKEDAEASAVWLCNAHLDADLCDADYYAIRRAQRSARDKWLLQERARLAEAKERREVEDFNRWVLNDIEKTQRLKRRSALAEENAAAFTLAKEQQAAKRARNAARLAAERREALNARHVQAREGDADSAF